MPVPFHFDMLLAVFDRAALMLICLFFLTRTRVLRQLLQKDEHTLSEKAIVTLIFSLFALFSTWSGVAVDGSLLNVRVIAVMAGGILFGPWVGVTTGVIAGLHRFLIDIDGVTSVPCLITSIVAGIASGVINRRVSKEQRWGAGIVGGMLCEALTMLLILLWAKPAALGLTIVSEIALPMILGASSIGLIVLLVQSVEGEKEAIAARQAKLALEIANKTLPLFRQVNSDALREVCDIIRRDIHADAVAITNTQQIQAYVGYGEQNYHNGDDGISPTTAQAIASGKIIIKNNDEAHRTRDIHSMLVIPLWEQGQVTGTLKIYYRRAHRITGSLKEMAIGLSQIISTQRMNPDTARQLVINLSRYLRYNLELNEDELIDIKKELWQVKDYIAIEQARFGDKLSMIYDIDDDLHFTLPSLLIQPLVENAIVHGIQPCRGKGVVTLSVKDLGDRVRIAVRDTGPGISDEVIRRVARNEMPGNKIGLLNVHHRVRLLTGQGLIIMRHQPGTEIAFSLPKNSQPLPAALSVQPEITV